MRKPAISEMRPIQTKPLGRSRTTPRQPKAVTPALPTVQAGDIPSKPQRAQAAKLEMKWCAGHSAWLLFVKFQQLTCSLCRECENRRNREAKAARVAAAITKTTQMEAARLAASQKRADDKARVAAALERATGERLTDFSTPDLERRAIASSTLDAKTQAGMWKIVLWHLQERETRLGEPALPKFRERLIETINPK